MEDQPQPPAKTARRRPKAVDIAVAVVVLAILVAIIVIGVRRTVETVQGIAG